MAPSRHAVHILPDVMIAAMRADEFTPEHFASLDRRLDLVVADLLWWSVALAEARAKPA